MSTQFLQLTGNLLYVTQRWKLPVIELTVGAGDDAASAPYSCCPRCCVGCVPLPCSLLSAGV